VIGDGPATDVLGGMRHGYDSLFIAGGLAAEALLDGQGAVRAEALSHYIEAEKITPTYTMAMLA
jgi:ribonucleotide monophosphatase NagD (HAD superfamily)